LIGTCMVVTVVIDWCVHSLTACCWLQDVVDDHNLNRQTLYSKSDVDVRKVDAAARTLDSVRTISICAMRREHHI